jgi:hypothetical protein
MDMKPLLSTRSLALGAASAIVGLLGCQLLAGIDERTVAVSDAGSAEECAPRQVDPCAYLPEFIGTQHVDGYDDDFCGVPAFIFDPANEQITSPNKTNSGLSLKATVQAAWSGGDGGALHVFVHVPKWPVVAELRYMIYEGDAVEIAVAVSRADLTGNPTGDLGTTHIIAAPIEDGGDGAGIAWTYPANGAPPTPGPITAPVQFAARVEQNVGYDIELEIPWSALLGGTQPQPALTTGSQVGFDVGIDLVLPDDAGQPTVYQAFHSVLALTEGQDPSDACIHGIAAYPGCDDRTWCHPTLGDP